jgi:hypothetical protein
MRIASFVMMASLIAAPAFAQTVTVQEANPGAAAQAGAAAQQQHYDAGNDVRAARQDQRAAHIDAATGHYGAAGAEQRAAGGDMRAARIHNAHARNEAVQSRRDDTTTIRVTP